MADDSQPTYSIETLLAAAETGFGGSVPPAIVQTSLFTFETYQAFEDRMSGRTGDPVYTRVGNPTVAAFEEMMALLEGGETAVGFASGMAAISSAVIPFVRPGDRIACVEHVYPDAYRLFEKLLRPFGVDVSYHSVTAFEQEPDLLKGVRLAYLESPNSVVLEAMDLAKVAGHAKRHGTLTVVDNSWATPIFQRPLQLGIDIVVHSASKYLGGHSDTVAGVLVSRKELTDKVREQALTLFGGKLAPFEAFLLVRGLRTLPVRMRQHQETANLFVEHLTGHPLVTRIHSPAAGSVASLTGRTGLLSVELSERVDIPAFCDALKLFHLGVSWGGFESLILPSRVGLAQAGEQNSMQRFGVSDRLVRLSLGLENPQDLWRDFSSALEACAK